MFNVHYTLCILYFQLQLLSFELYLNTWMCTCIYMLYHFGNYFSVIIIWFKWSHLLFVSLFFLPSFSCILLHYYITLQRESGAIKKREREICKLDFFCWIFSFTFSLSFSFSSSERMSEWENEQENCLYESQWPIMSGGRKSKFLHLYAVHYLPIQEKGFPSKLSRHAHPFT